MKDLIERLEKATGPDSDLDLAIGHWLWQTTNAGKPWECFDYGAGGPGRKFTSSIDCALTLVPEGQFWSIEQAGPYADGRPSNPRARLWALIQTDYGPGVGLRQDVHAATPAIALCIASLKARMMSK